MSTPKNFNITPHPRILPMLGEIVLSQPKCLAELLDNSVDGFLEASRSGHPIPQAHVHISVPLDAKAQGQISVKDNGPGMDFATLERSARAGWTSHDPINNLGLFGMGFNIATARLGAKTTIWTTQAGAAEWVGMAIDFDELSKAQGFFTPVLTRVKPNRETSGTEIVIERLKPEQKEWFAKKGNVYNMGRFFGRTYSAMLGAGQPIRFLLQLNGNQVRARPHCVWGAPGDTPRSADHPQLGTVEAYQPLNFELAQRDFCVQCWNWLSAGQTVCPQCGVDGDLRKRARRVHGWIGLQRYLDESDFGLDFLRNGRKIEIGNKDLFNWQDEGADNPAVEYPIDEMRNRGRIVGEIHIDHCRVPYTKDRFVREDTAWTEMVQLVRGEGPLQPEKAKERGFSGNISPLYKLYQMFRRNSPHNKKLGGWRKLLVVEENELAVAMAKRFENGEPDYQSDTKWWELAKQADEKVLTGGAPPGGGSGGSGAGGGALGGGGASGGGQGTGTLGGGGPVIGGTPTPPRTALADLSQLYLEDSTGQRFDVKAFSISPADPGIAASLPWAIWKSTSGPWEFLVRADHPVFASVTMTPLDALLMQLAWQVADFTREHGLTGGDFARIVTNLRAKYAKRHEIDPASLCQEAERQLQEIAKSAIDRLEPAVTTKFFDGLGTSQEQVSVTMAKRGVVDARSAIESGRFLQYAQPSIIRDFVMSHLDLFLDGKYWDDPFATLNLGSPTATQIAKERVISFYSSLLADAVWLAEQGEDELENSSRERLMRASASLQILGMGGLPQDAPPPA